MHLDEKVVLVGVLSPCARGYIPDLLRRFILRLSCLSGDRIRNLVGNASTSCTRAKDHHSHIFQFDFAGLKGRQHGSESDTPRALDVIIETRDLRLIPIEYSPCIVQTKILTDIVSSVSNDKERTISHTSVCKPAEIVCGQPLQIYPQIYRTSPL